MRGSIRRGLWSSVLVAVFTIGLAGCTNLPGQRIDTGSDSEVLAGLVEETRVRYDQPGMAFAVIHNDEISSAATGVAVLGRGIPIADGSRFHIGSITKTMTAVLIAQLVEEGVLYYETTLRQALPDTPMLEAYRRVTVHDLLLSRAGIIPFQRQDLEDPEVAQRLWEEIPSEYTDPVQQRRPMHTIRISRAATIHRPRGVRARFPSRSMMTTSFPRG